MTLLQSDSFNGPFSQVADGSAVMSPMNRRNPDLSEADGHFGWDVVAGFYKVKAAKDGCHAPGNSGQAFTETEVQTIPPPVTNLDIRLDCPAPTPVQNLQLPAARLRASLALGRGGRVKVARNGTFTIKSSTIGCPAESRSPCTAAVAVSALVPKRKRKAKLGLGSTTVTVLPGKAVPVSGRLSTKGLAKLKALHKIKADVSIQAGVPGGEGGSGTIIATLVPPSPPKR